MLRELLASFDIDTGQAATALKTVDGALSKTSATLNSLAEAFIGSAIVGGIKSFIQDQIDAAKEVRLTAAKLGVSTDALQEWTFAAGTAGISAEGMATGLKFLNKNMGLALDGNEEAAKAFAKLGVPVRNADGSVRELGDVMPQIADAFAGMSSQQERTTVAMQVFGRAGADLLPLLQEGGKNLDELRAKFEALGGGMSKDFIQRSKDAGRAMGAAKFGLQAFKRAIVYEALPGVIKYAQHMQKAAAALVRVNRETNLAKYTMSAFGVASAVATARSAVGFAKLLGVVPKDASFWKAALGLGEILIAVALVALLALAIEDVITFAQGGDSVIGDLMNQFLTAGEAADLADSLNMAWASISQTFTDLKPTLLAVAKTLLKVAVEIAPILVGAFDFLVRLIASAITLLAAFVEGLVKIPEAIKKGDFEVIGKVIDRAGNAVFGTGGLFGDKPGEGPQAMKVRQGTGVPAGPTTVQQTNHVTNTVYGVKDADAAGKAVKSGTSDALDGQIDAALAGMGGG